MRLVDRVIMLLIKQSILRCMVPSQGLYDIGQILPEKILLCMWEFAPTYGESVSLASKRML